MAEKTSLLLRLRHSHHLCDATPFYDFSPLNLYILQDRRGAASLDYWGSLYIYYRFAVSLDNNIKLISGGSSRSHVASELCPGYGSVPVWYCTMTWADF